uniref:Chromo domain-containing protein n=1 Tax=Ananas comosus var. bracteatus TaxID=296719 RepID=A0A6V7NJK6_ANACO|nr:unnamed protein product [Ananas comosus var. bracteatus]
MLRACVLDFGGGWYRHLRLVEFAYNNSYQASIQMAPFEALYGCRCRSPLFWSDVGERRTLGPEILIEAEEKIGEDLSYEERPVRILARESRNCATGHTFVKVQWSNHEEREATWEPETVKKESYPYLVVGEFRRSHLRAQHTASGETEGHVLCSLDVLVAQNMVPGAQKCPFLLGHWIAAVSLGTYLNSPAPYKYLVYVPIELFYLSSATTSSVLAHARRRKVGFRRNLVCWILDLQRNPRRPKLQILVEVSLVELRKWDFGPEIDHSSVFAGFGTILRGVVAGLEVLPAALLVIRDHLAARNCSRGGCIIGFAPNSTEIRCILGWVAPTSATPETEPQVSAAAPSANQDRGKGVAS